VIAVDAGFKDGRSMTGAAFDSVEQPHDVLAKVGVRPEQVETLVLTHLHFDHAGNFDAYPNARIYLQRREYDGWKTVLANLDGRPASKQSWQLSSLDVALFERLDQAIAAGRVIFLDGDLEIAPGIVCHLAADTHTFGSQWVEVRTANGPYVLAGDCVYSYANIERLWPPGYLQGNAWNYVALMEALTVLVEGRLERIVPGHDMRVFQRCRSWVAGLNPVAEVYLAAGEVAY
jgi:glyoxylase-like metal-dependent hydrolase (beta-lactamase superfamily II)